MNKFIVLVLILPLFGCQQNIKNTIKYRNLEDYKKIAAYIIDKNYHEGFSKSLVWEKSNSPDSTVKVFMEKNRINNIQTVGRILVSDEYLKTNLPDYRDSVIEFHYSFVPIFGKRKELYIDFSSIPPTESYKKNGVKQIVFEKGIYYIEF